MIDYKSQNENLSPRTHHNQTANSDSAAGWTDTAATSRKKKSDAEHKQGVFVGAEPARYKGNLRGRSRPGAESLQGESGHRASRTSRQHLLGTVWISLETTQEKRRAVSIKHAY